MDDILQTINTYILPHWPFIIAVTVFAIISQFVSKSVFTRERAYQKRTGPGAKFVEHFFWWGRETLSIHMITLGSALGFIWRNPEGVTPAWGFVSSAAYFAGAGAISLFAWSVVKGYLKKKGIDLELPGGVSSVTVLYPTTPPSADTNAVLAVGQVKESVATVALVQESVATAVKDSDSAG